MKKIVSVVLVLISMGVNSVSAADTSMTDILEYAQRTAKDYCSPKNTRCINEFSNQVIISYKDGQMDSRSRFKDHSLSKRYESRLLLTECIPSDEKYRTICESMVDRLVDSYNRGLNSK